MENVEWKIHLRSHREKVFEFLTTDKGRSLFWAEFTVEEKGVIHFVFPSGQEYKSVIVEKNHPDTFAIEYFHSLVIFHLTSFHGEHGTDLQLINKNIPIEEHDQVTTGWISVLLSLKAAVDFGVDLRNHNPMKCWKQKYVDN
jgi:hypothetical protein